MRHRRPDRGLASKGLWSVLTAGVQLAQGLAISVVAARLLTRCAAGDPLFLRKCR